MQAARGEGSAKRVAQGGAGQRGERRARAAAQAVANAAGGGRHVGVKSQVSGRGRSHNRRMDRINPWLLPPLAVLVALAVWKGPQSPGFKPGGPGATLTRPAERRR